jgi:hypothetical protein
MNRPQWLVVRASLAICLGLLGSASGVRAQDTGGVVELGKLKSRVPAEWQPVKPAEPSHYRQYRLEPVRDDKDAALLVIDFLGKGRGVSTGEQVKRWKAMFLPPEGKGLDDVARVRVLKVGDAAMTYLDVRGDYKGLPGDPATPRQNYRLLGVYFDAPQGPYVIRLCGPADTVAFYRDGFENWVKAFK